MSPSGAERLLHIKERISYIRDLLDGMTLQDLKQQPAALAAFERFLEIISEASRHVPPEWKAGAAEVPWRDVADIGNLLRHAYHRTVVPRLWAIYEVHLDSLEAAVDRLMAEHPVEDRSR